MDIDMADHSSNSVSPGGSSSLSPDSSPLSVICPHPGGSPNPRVSSSGINLGLESPDSFVSSASSTGRGKSRGGGKNDLRCAVCGDKALGHNFDAITCESCKAFFRRNAGKGEQHFRCANGGRCAVSVNNRRFCKHCRLKKCFAVGMRKEYIMSEAEKAEKQKKISQNKIIKKLESHGWIAKDLTPSEISERNLLDDKTIELIDEVNRAHRISLQVSMGQRRGDREQPKFSDLINLAEVSMRRVIDLAKKIPNFRDLEQQDQIALLKGGSVELLFLRGVISYDISKDRFLDRNDDEREDAVNLTSMIDAAERQSTASPGSCTSEGGCSSTGCSSTGCSSTGCSMEHEHQNHDEVSVGILFRGIAESLIAELKCDEVQLLLLLLICLFTPDRLSPSRVEERKQVESIQLFYTDLLSKYMCCRFPVREGRRLFAHVLVKLVDLRQVAVTLTPQISNVDPNEVQPLMNEILDLSLEGTDSPETPTKQEKHDQYHPGHHLHPPHHHHHHHHHNNQQQVHTTVGFGQVPSGGLLISGNQQQSQTGPQQSPYSSLSHSTQYQCSPTVSSWPLSFPYAAYLEQASPLYEKMEPAESCDDYCNDVSSSSLHYFSETATLE